MKKTETVIIEGINLIKTSDEERISHVGSHRRRLETKECIVSNYKDEVIWYYQSTPSKEFLDRVKREIALIIWNNGGKSENLREIKKKINSNINLQK